MPTLERPARRNLVASRSAALRPAEIEIELRITVYRSPAAPPPPEGFGGWTVGSGGLTAGAPDSIEGPGEEAREADSAYERPEAESSDGPAEDAVPAAAPGFARVPSRGTNGSFSWKVPARASDRGLDVATPLVRRGAGVAPCSVATSGAADGAEEPPRSFGPWNASSATRTTAPPIAIRFCRCWLSTLLALTSGSGSRGRRRRHAGTCPVDEGVHCESCFHAW